MIIDNNMGETLKVGYVDKNAELVKEIVKDVIDPYEPRVEWWSVEEAAEKMAKMKDGKFKELVESYIQMAYDSGQPANLLEDLLKEI